MKIAHIFLILTLATFFGACSLSSALVKERHIASSESENFLPELKSPTQTFNSSWALMLREGKIWGRPLTADAPSEWSLFQGTGLPHPKKESAFPVPESILEISADGDNLIALGPDRTVHYMKFGTGLWTKKWGKPFSGVLKIPESVRSWTISHRGPEAGGYEDIDGNPHPVGAGVTTLYILSADGSQIFYADPWVEVGFDHEVNLPERGRFIAESLSSSASTLFVINSIGEMYTRLADFDSMGTNPVLPYTYKRGGLRGDVVRVLPAEDWRAQPRITEDMGQITSLISIHQTGKGNSARELRVEGVNAEGRTGYFSKAIFDESWHFVETGRAVTRSFLDNKAPLESRLLSPSKDKTLPVIFSGFHKGTTGFIENFNPVIEQSKIRMNVEGKDYVFDFYSTDTMFVPDEEKGYTKHNGVIIVPQEIQKELPRQFRDNDSQIHVKMKIYNDRIEMKRKSQTTEAIFKWLLRRAYPINDDSEN